MAGRDGLVNMETGIENSEGMHLSRPLPTPAWRDEGAGGVTPAEMPVSDARSNTMAAHAVDIICDLEPPNKHDIEEKVNALAQR